MSNPNRYPSDEDIKEVTAGEWETTPTPAEAWDVSEEELAVIDQETLDQADRFPDMHDDFGKASLDQHPEK